MEECENTQYEQAAKAEALQFIETMNQYGNIFADLCEERHRAGQEEYGKFTFLGNDVIRMMIEELADTVNYCRYQAVKLLFLQTALEEHLADSGLTEEGQEEIVIGLQSFKGTREGWSKDR